MMSLYPISCLWSALLCSYASYCCLGALGGLFLQVNNGEESAREKALFYLSSTVVENSAAVLNSDEARQRYILEEVKKVTARLPESDTLVCICCVLMIMSVSDGSL